MQDEHFMRGWSDNHARFSTDVDRGFGALAGMIGHLRRRRNDRDAHLRRRLGIGRSAAPDN